MSLHLDEAYRRAADLAERRRSIHADELRAIAETVARHGAWSNEGIRALHNLRAKADEIEEWEASTAPAGHHGVLPDDVVVLRNHRLWRVRT